MLYSEFTDRTGATIGAEIYHKLVEPPYYDYPGDKDEYCRDWLVRQMALMTETLAEEAYLEDNHASSGMFFSSANVVEEYEYDDAYCLLYDDADANMFNVEICVDLETYQLVCKAIKDNRELVGQLVLNDDYSFDGVEVFTFMPEPEFEMANASANI